VHAYLQQKKVRFGWVRSGTRRIAASANTYDYANSAADSSVAPTNALSDSQRATIAAKTG